LAESRTGSGQEPQVTEGSTSESLLMLPFEIGSHCAAQAGLNS
jgi:hypothetical protein